MSGKMPYQSPTLTKWGSITDLTQGTGMTTSSDDFVSCPPQMDAFVGSNDNTVFECPEE
jgi:hypothetical protein